MNNSIDMVKCTAAAGLARVASALSLVMGVSFSASAATIGYLGTLTGPNALVGQEQLDGFLLAIEQWNGKLGGQPVTVLREDDQNKPDVGVLAARKFIEKDKVDAIVGLGGSNVLMAILPRLAEAGVVAVSTNAGPSALAGAQCKPNVFSVAWQNDGAAEAMGKWVTDRGIKRMFLMAPNFQAGKDMLAGFKRMYRGTVVDELYTSFNQPDYSSEIAQLQAASPDAAFVFYPGSIGINFVKQMHQSGVLAQVPVYSVFTIDALTLPALRDAAQGVVSTAVYDAALDNPENKAFVAAFEAKYKRAPSPYAAVAWDAAQVLDLALKKVAGNTTDKVAFAKAVKAAGAEFKSVRGVFRFNNNNLPIQNFYAFQVVKAEGRLVTRQVGVPLANHADSYHTQCPLK